MADTAHPATSPALWRTTAPDRAANPPLQGACEADAVIVGAGFTGLRAALALAEAGLRVVVLDAEDVAGGASGRSGGQVNPMLPFNTPTQLRDLLPAPYYERLTAAALGSADELFALIDRYGLDCQARQKGWLRVNHNDRALDYAKETVAAWNAAGADMQIVGGAELAALSGTRAYGTGILTPGGGAVHPLMLSQELARCAVARGAVIHGQSRVRSLSRRDGKWVAEAGAGAVRADWAVIATNGYTDDLVPGLARTILPLTPMQIATAPLSENMIAEILPQGHTISDSRRIIMYARREPDNRIVYGGLGRLRRDGAVSGGDWLLRDVRRVYPQLNDADWTHCWTGRIALTDDHLPHLHEPQPGLLIGLGYNGRGVAISHVMGRVMAERVLGAAPGDLAFPCSPLRPFALRLLKQTGMQGALWLMRLLDRLETR